MTQRELFPAKSQCAEILAYLETGRSITPLEALERFGCFRLGGRIFDLKEAGHNIETTMIEKNGRHSTGNTLSD